MNKKERIVLLTILTIIAITVSIDITTDIQQGVSQWHVFIEILIGISTLFGIFFILKNTINLKHELSDAIIKNEQLKLEAKEWKVTAKKYIDGLSISIDQQLTKWNLSEAEKEVALLLLKGLSLKEIADIRHTTEKTSRVQSIAIYSKSGLTGRSELAAFFLEDLLLPQTHKS